MTFCANSSQHDPQHIRLPRINAGRKVPTVTARSLAKIASCVASAAHSDRLLKTVGLDRETIARPNIRVPFSDMMMLSEHASRLTRDSAFGLHVGERTPESEYGLMGNLQVTSSTLREALNCLARFLPIWTSAGTFSLEMDGPTAHFQWRYASASLPEERHDCEMSMATVMRLNRLTRKERWWPKEVWFQHSRPRDISEHVRIFRAPVRFSMRINALLLDSRTLDLSLKTKRPASHRQMTNAAEELLPQAECDVSVSQSAASFIRQNLGKCSVELDAAASALGFSRRGLQRILRHEATSYRQLVEETRRDLADYLLQEIGISSTQTSEVLGYSEQSAFHGAFRRWHGKDPAPIAI